MIHVERITKRFGRVRAVDDLSFEVARGETFAIIGPNGAGKTTTLKILLGLARPDQGSVTIGEARRHPHDRQARESIGYVPQRVAFPAQRTVREVLQFFADLRGLTHEDVTRTLARVGMQDVAARPAAQLSGGYSQRLSLAQALLGNPELLILDEPTASLDPEATWEFRTLLEQLRREGTTILLCSHLLSEVERVADRVLILVEGRRAALESLDDLRLRQMRAAHLIIEMERPDPRALPALQARGFTPEPHGANALVVDGSNGHGFEALETLRATGVAVRSFEIQRPTLEEMFLAVVKRGRDHA
jgi:heme ABC exporter ATP-binding subunit CcmA